MAVSLASYLENSARRLPGNTVFDCAARPCNTQRQQSLSHLCKPQKHCPELLQLSRLWTQRNSPLYHKSVVGNYLSMLIIEVLTGRCQRNTIASCTSSLEGSRQVQLIWLNAPWPGFLLLTRSPKPILRRAALFVGLALTLF